MKKMTIILLVLLLALSSSALTAQESVTITFWSHTHPPMVDLNEALIAEYMDLNPNVTIEYQVIPNNLFFETMLVSTSTGVGPDILNMGNAQLISDYLPRGLIAEVDYEALGFDSMEALLATYVPNALAGAMMDGSYYGLPSEINTDMLAIYTPDLVEAGYPEDWAPATWDELGEVAGELSRFDENGNQTHRGFDLVYLHAGWFSNQFQTLAMQTGCTYYNEALTESTINSPECVAAAQIWHDMIFEYQAANPSLSSRESTVPLQDYIDGTVSMTFIQPWGMELVRQGDMERWENTRLVALPQVDPENPQSKINAYYWAVNSGSAVQEEAWKFIAFMASHPGRWLLEVNFLQGNVGMDELPEAADFPYADQWMLGLDSGDFFQLYPAANETNEALRVALENILFNNTDIQSTLDNLKAELDFILQ